MISRQSLTPRWAGTTLGAVDADLLFAIDDEQIAAAQECSNIGAAIALCDHRPFRKTERFSNRDYTGVRGIARRVFHAR